MEEKDSRDLARCGNGSESDAARNTAQFYRSPVEIDAASLVTINRLARSRTPVRQIAAALGMSHTTLNAMLKNERSPAYLSYQKGLNMPVERAMDVLLDLIDANETPHNTKAALSMFILKTAGGFTEKRAIEVSGPDGGAIETREVRVDVSGASVADMKRVIEMLEGQGVKGLEED